MREISEVRMAKREEGELEMEGSREEAAVSRRKASEEGFRVAVDAFGVSRQESELLLGSGGKDQVVWEELEEFELTVEVWEEVCTKEV